MKKLLIATDCFLPRKDGVARFLEELIPRLSKKYEILVLAPKFRGKSPEFPSDIVRFSLTKIKFADISISFPNPKMVKHYIEDADIVWTQTMGPVGALAIHYAYKLKKPLFSFVHSIEWELFSESVGKPFSFFVKIFTKMFVRRLYNKASMIMAPSKEVAEILTKENINALKHIVYLGINSEKFKPPESKTKAKEKLGIDPDSKIIGYCGRIGREKDLITLYRAFVQLDKKRNIKLMIVGGGTRQQTKIFSKTEHIILPGTVDDVLPYLQAMDIYVLPSLTETTSLATLEAMSSGLPVISTPVGLVKKYIKNKQNGLIFPRRNSFILRKKIEYLLENPHISADIGKNARQMIINRFSWDNTYEEIVKAFEIYD